MNDVTIDETKLTAEADAALADLPADPLAPFDSQGEAVPASWVPIIEGVTPMLRIGVFPQWNITDAEAREFCESLGQSLDQLFPGGLDGKYACFVRFLVCCGGIVTVRALQLGTLPPLGPKRAAKKPEAGNGAGNDQERKAA